MRSLLAVVAVSLTLPLSAATISIRVTDPAGAAVPDAVVYAVPAAPIHVDHNVAIMDQKDRTFVPHVLPIQVGTWVQFPNSDNIRHQVFSVSPVRRFQLPLYIGKPSYPVQFPTAGVVQIGCNIHEEMSAWIVVVDTPYFAKTEGVGVSLTGIAAGKYTVHVWYPGMRKEPPTQVLTVAADDSPALAFVTAK